jgi:hypothetical protein
MELLATPDLFKRASGKIVRSFAFEVLSDGNLEDIRADEAESWWNKLLDTPVTMHASPGPAQVVRIDNPEFIGSGLYWNDAVVHFSCFPKETAPGSNRRPSTLRSSATERRNRLKNH